MKILVTTHAQPKFLPKTLLDPSEIVAGPQYNNVVQNSRVRFMGTPGGAFSFRRLLEKLPVNQRPDLVLVHADATMGCTPLDFPEDLPRILLVGDTHHLGAPLRKLLNYAGQGGFQAAVVWNRQHAHFFKEAGVPHVFWMPGLTFGIPAVPPATQRDPFISFFGQIGSYHPRRVRLVEQLKEKDLPFVASPLPRHEGLELFARSLLAFNCSLNGEFNLRIFEASSTGCAVLTDKLKPHTGLDLFYKDGESMITYSNEEELVEKARYYLEHPEEAIRIGKKGRQIYERYFTSEGRREAFMTLINGGNPVPEFLLQDEPRCRLPRATAQTADALKRRVELYEWMQEKHRIEEELLVEVASAVSPQIPADLADLARLTLHIPSPSSHSEEWLAALEALGVDWVPEPAARQDLLICSFGDLGNEELLTRIFNPSCRALFIEGIPEAAFEVVASNLASAALTRGPVRGLFERK